MREINLWPPTKFYTGDISQCASEPRIDGQKYAALPQRFIEAVNQASKQQGGMDGTVMFRWSPAKEQEGTDDEVIDHVIKTIEAEFPDQIPLTPPD